ncbi:Glycosyl transferases group 1 [Pseudodesulfovibrio hydrargyri]|uniref:Glycosyl transferases group 1 n=1 Tax=Pseudodesulfovibrio hydrargyri TaxID=2125990 RepID=A0A1J5MVP3_9BACT|nr:glycosyltransferase [Pseudodesulfovibrio hydrargyri]OIQ50042.1 Glycosyl transferases group 1 [Pseudodesulfovibrio hydrargyri]
MAKRMLIVPERWEHHIAQSSIDHMLEFLDGYALYDAAKGGFQALPDGFFQSIGAVPNLRTAYAERSFRRELSLIADLAGHSGTMVHFLNGESATYLTPRHKNGNTILATYHQPRSVMEDIIPDKSHFPRHDGVIVIAPNQVEYFEEITGKGKVHLVPLGVEETFFPFGAPQGRVPRVLFVGNWLRDFPTLVRAAVLIKAEAPEVEVACVTPPKNHALFDGLDVTLLTGIPTEDLLELYRTSAAFLFPVADCTGNTALLEAMCSGLPVVANRKVLETGYVNEECALVTPDGDPEAMARHCLELVRDDSLRRLKSEAVRQWVSDRFNWRRVSSIQKDVYARYGWEG